MVALIVVLVILLLIAGGISAASSVKVIPEYERAVFFRFGRVVPKPRGPGIIIKLPVMHRLQRVTLRVEVVDIPPQSVITADNVTVQVDAVVYFQVMDPVKAVIAVDNFRFACQRIAMTSLRSIIGRHELDQLLAHRDDINNELRAQIALSTHHWGVEVRQVEIKDIVLPPELISAMARQAEAERVRRAKVISASGEQESSVGLARAAAKLAESPGALHLRTLHALTEIANENRATIIVPLPVELLAGLKGIIDNSSHSLDQTSVADKIPVADQASLTGQVSVTGQASLTGNDEVPTSGIDQVPVINPAIDTVQFQAHGE